MAGSRRGWKALRDMTVRHRRHAGLVRGALTLFLLATAALAGPRADVIDRILAVVGHELITLSDTTAAFKLGLVPPPAPGTDRIRATLDALISRQLELAEANRYQPPEPPPAEIDARLEAVRSRAETPQMFAAALAEAGLSEEQLRLRLRDDLRIEAFLAQRFGSTRQPSEQELQDYYRLHQADYTTAGAVRAFAEVRDAIQAQVTAAQRAALINEWLEGLRRRAEIADLYVTAR